jgi:hypothetical protein
MTVANQTARTSAVGTAAAGQEIAFSFPINDTSDLVVKTRITSTGVESDALTEDTDYTVEISGDTGGTVTMVAAVAATSEIHIYRNTPRTQSLDLEQGGTFNAENVEDALDKNSRITNDNADKLSRAIVAPSTDSSSLDMTLPSSVDRASNFLAFNSDGEPTVVASVAPSTTTITAAAETVLDDASVAAMRTTLGVAIGTDVQAYSAYITAIAALARTDGNIVVGNGTTWVAESGATARTSLGAAADTDVIKKDASVAYTGTGVGFKDEDDMLSNSAVAPPSQQSVRAFLYSIVSYDGDVITYDGEVVTYV